MSEINYEIANIVEVHEIPDNAVVVVKLPISDLMPPKAIDSYVESIAKRMTPIFEKKAKNVDVIYLPFRGDYPMIEVKKEEDEPTR